MKTCIKCKEVKSKSEFCKDKSKKDGLQSQCKFCCKRYRQENKELIAIRGKAHREPIRNQLALKAKAYRKANKESIASRKKIYYVANIEKIIVRNKDYCNANKQKIAARQRIYYDANKERLNSYSKLYAWDARHPERKKARCQKRRALKLAAEGSFTNLDIKNLFSLQNSKCVYCQIELIIKGVAIYHVDHIIPLKLGGSNWAENLQLLCPFCNLSKGSKHPDVYEKEINYNRNKD